ncbi:neuromedin-U receptor 1 isoform X1 [Erinaceus europaeus]|uniref:Neuromedin-U receptor 1 isoform X1 n=1 Tax=Erinaceus europaeus TaxID=9365 RepID=A0ABM3XLP7_ERIEU|nr:neuromedin-U receptor 1 isoform X1 [Erinaceus europaeus]
MHPRAPAWVQCGQHGSLVTSGASLSFLQASLCHNCSTLAGNPFLGRAGSPAACNLSEAPEGFHPGDLNLTDEELRLKYLGPQRSDLFAPICAVYLLVGAVGTVGNGLTCAVILRHPAMRTPTNLYLFSLAVSDLLVLLLGLPLELYELWCNYPFALGAGGCFFRTLLFETVCLASVLNVTALSAERFVAVLQPLRARRLGTRARVRRVLGALWALALLCALPNASLHGLRPLELPCRGAVPDSTTCALVRPRQLYNLVVQVTTLLFFCLPMATISVLYLLIGLRLRRERLLLLPKAKGGARARETQRLQRLQDRGRTQVTKMLFVLVVVFAVCWAPFHVDRLMWSFVARWTDALQLAYQYVHVVSGVFFYLSSAANPVLYSLMSTRFRETFQEALGLGSRCRRRRPRGSHSLSRATTGSTLGDLGGPVSRLQLLPEDGGPEGQQQMGPLGPGKWGGGPGMLEGPQDLHPHPDPAKVLSA